MPFFTRLLSFLILLFTFFSVAALLLVLGDEEDGSFPALRRFFLGRETWLEATFKQMKGAEMAEGELGELES